MARGYDRPWRRPEPLFARRLAKLGIISFSDVLELRYWPAAGLLGAVVMGVYEIIVVVTQVLAIGTLFTVVRGISSTLAIALAGGAVLRYSVAGECGLSASPTSSSSW